MRLYIAYRYSANNVIDVLQNIGKAIRVGHEAAMIKGVYPFIPHLDCLVAMQEPVLPLEYYYNCSIAYLDVCDAMLLVDSNDLITSKGVLKEFEHCLRFNKPIFYDVKDIPLAIRGCFGADRNCTIPCDNQKPSCKKCNIDRCK